MTGNDRREPIISAIGVVLALSPLGNLLWSSYWTHSPIWASPDYLFEFAKTLSPLILFLWFAYFLTGLILLSGKRATLDFSLFVLFIALGFGIVTFKRYSEAKQLQAIISILLNMGLFVTVGILRLQKPRMAEARNSVVATSPATTPTTVMSESPSPQIKFSCDFITIVKINFPGFPEAMVLRKIDEAGFETELTRPYLAEHLLNKKVEVGFWQSPRLTAKIAEQKGPMIYFKFLEKQNIQGLRNELARMSALSKPNSTVA